jgi:putative Mn2+ efflux pump MntP
VGGQERKFVLTGALILIALGILIILNSSRVYGFNESWPILLIVISIGTLVQRINDIGGWVIGIVGTVFLAIKNFYPGIEYWAQYVLPAVLILLGVYILYEYLMKTKKGKAG